MTPEPGVSMLRSHWHALHTPRRRTRATLA